MKRLPLAWFAVKGFWCCITDASRIVDKGIILTGGGANLNGLQELLEEELKVPILMAETPLTCVAEGTGVLLNNRKELEGNQ